MSESINDKARSRSLQLFTYLRESIQQKSKVVRDIGDYEEIISFDDIPKINGAKCISWTSIAPDKDPTEDWIELRKPKRPSPPVLANELEDWVDRNSLSDSSSMPKILSSIILINETGEDQESTVLELKDHPKIEELFHEYVQGKWKAWAENDKIERNLESIYKKLFSIYQKNKKFGEAYELVVGICLLKYKNGPHEIKRHLFTVPATIVFEQKTGKLTVSGSAEGIKLTLEEDMLEVTNRPIPENITSIENMMIECEDKIWDGISIHELGKSYANAMPSGDGEYFERLNHKDISASQKPQVVYSPYLILRKNTDRSLLNVYNSLVSAMVTGGIVPRGIMNIVGVKDGVGDGQNDTSGASINPTSSEVYFPLDSNREQKAIAEKLQTNSAVLVQGPPGTGKSHTIANLICHLLAQGQRILVTSHTTRALAVLKKKIPKDVAPLCVELLGSDHGSMKSLEDSVYGILAKYNAYDPSITLNKIQKLKALLSEKRSEYAICLSQIREIRERDIFAHVRINGKYSGTLETIAREIVKEASKFSWFEDDASSMKDVVTSESLQQFKQLYGAIRSFPKEVESAKIPLESFEKLIQLEALFVEEANVKAILGGSDNSSHLNINLNDKSIAELQEAAQRLDQLFKGLSEANTHWNSKALIEILDGRELIWIKRLEESHKVLKEISKLKDNLPKKVVGLDKYPAQHVRLHVTRLIAHFSSGKGLGFWIFKPKIIVDASFVLNEIFVDDIPCKEHKLTLAPLENYLSAEILLEDFLHLWESLFDFEAKRQQTKFEQCREIVMQLEAILEISRIVPRVQRVIGSKIQEKTVSSLINLQEEIFTVVHRRSLQKIQEQIGKESLFLTQKHDSALLNRYSANLQEAVTNRDLPSIHNLLIELKDIKMKQEILQRCANLSNLFQRNFPLLYSNFIKAPDDSNWDTYFTAIQDAVAFSKTKQWLNEQNDPGRLKNLNYQQEHLRKEIQQITSSLASELAWAECFSNKKRFGDEQREALVAWQKAVNKIGKGTGKHANKHRKDARTHMESCRPAIPAWIMPMHKVAEVTEIAPEAFDVVILDEASQSGPEAIFLQYIGKKIVVVGDDKQISPDNVGVDREGLYSIHQRYLGDIPRSDIIGPDNSFFDIADVRYGGRIRLREHFRCMPEIIQFSNNLCYSSEPLIPLKQFGTNRITPTVSAVHIQGGYLSGSDTRKINSVEAEAIVNKIEELVKNPRYKGKTFGVISLLGEWQAKEIEKLLINKIGAEEIEEREIVCGDAYAFQGDERDVMFLSLVSAFEEGKRIGALTKEKDKRRFNVAASRAKEQMFLFHSVTLNDLNPECMRYKILDYCMQPKIDQIDVDGVDITSIKVLHTTADKSIVKPPAPFDSWFEVDIFLKIQERGFRVIPQYEVNGRRIDLVVEGMSGRLAVECDGDRWHGPDQYDLDMARQRDLERCGWVFYRIRGSEYAYNPVGTLGGLWASLDKMGITPRAVEQSSSNLSLESKSEILETAPNVEAQLDLVVAHNSEEPPAFLGLSEDWANSLTRENIADALTKLGLDVRDKRPLKGSLWIVGDDRLNPLLNLLRKQGFNFVFAKNGSRTTENQPSWFLK